MRSSANLPLLFMAVLIALTPRLCRADTISHALDQYALYCETGVNLTGRAQVFGHLGVAGSLTIGDDAVLHSDALAGGSLAGRYRITVNGRVMAAGSMSLLHDSRFGSWVQAGGSMTIADRVSIAGDALAAGAISRGGSASIGGDLTPYTAPAHAWVRPTVAEPAFTPGGSSITVNYDQTQAITPGSYGALTMRDRSRVVLSSGTYHFSRINSASDCVFEIDDSSGPVNIYVQGGLTFGYRAVIDCDESSASNITWWGGGDIVVRPDITLIGHIRGFANVNLGDRVRTVGGVYAKAGFSCGWDVVFETAEPPMVFYVRPGGSDANNGASVLTAFATVQKAVSMCAAAGATVYVAPGVYNESVAIGGSGDGAGAATATADSPTRVIADVTGEHTGADPGRVIIDGQSVRQYGFTLTDIDHWELSGFTLRNQTRTGVRAAGGGLSVTGFDIEVPLGYGIDVDAEGDVLISGSRFSRDLLSGSAIWVEPGNVSSPISIAVVGNDLSMRGDLYGATAMDTTWETFFGSGVTSNRYGVGVYSLTTRTDEILIANNVISDCYLPIFTSVYSYSDTQLTVANNTITESFYGMQVHQLSYGRTSVINNICAGCNYGMVFTRLRGTQTTISRNLEHSIERDLGLLRIGYWSGIITGDPRFADAREGEFLLTTGSAAIDAGVSTNAPSTDIDGYSRPSDGDNDGVAAHDIGAYEQVAQSDTVKVIRWREIGAEGNR